jgi:hypothetical protein
MYRFNYCQNLPDFYNDYTAPFVVGFAFVAAGSASCLKAHTDRTRFCNATRIFSFQKQIKPSMDKNFTRYADQIAKIA